MFLCLYRVDVRLKIVISRACSLNAVDDVLLLLLPVWVSQSEKSESREWTSSVQLHWHLTMDSDRQSENNGIRLATRRDLFRLLAFLDEKLPHLCDVSLFHLNGWEFFKLTCCFQIYDHVLTHLLTTNPNYRVHFLCDPTGEYVAIVGTKRDWRRLLGNNETQVFE